MSTFIVIHPCGDLARVGVADISGTEYEMSDYRVASVRLFDTRLNAHRHASNLALLNGLQYDGNGLPLDHPEYLAPVQAKCPCCGGAP